MDCLLSVIITTYKRNPEMIMRAVQSIQKQTYKNIEIFIVDDNENNSEYSKKLKEVFSNMEKITYLKQDGNKGACAARNLGIKHANGEFIGFLDDDDTWEETKAEKQLLKFEEGGEDVGLVFCLGNVVDMNENPPKRKDYYTSKFFKPELTYLDLLRADAIGSTSQGMVRKSCFDKVGGFNVDLPARQDYEMWLRLSKNYRVLGVKERLFNYIQHGEEQITKSGKKSLTGYKIVYNLYRADFEGDLEARISILSRMMQASKGYSFFDFWYYRLAKHWYMLLKKRKHA